jgi:hypothetical protein
MRNVPLPVRGLEERESVAVGATRSVVLNIATLPLRGAAVMLAAAFPVSYRH